MISADVCGWVPGCGGEAVGYRNGLNPRTPVCANHSEQGRPSETEWLLRMAETTAQRATCSRLSVGAVLARDGRILSTGYNGAPVGEAHCHHDTDEPCTRSVHAEVNALAFAARHGVSTEQATLYITHNPCFACAGLIMNAGIQTVIFREHYRSNAGLDRLVDAEVACFRR